ncbi:MAG: hypothetical protein JO212_03020, partial [Acetobacteraceae bacterium]|nr:hypothetical protein [Acetobacteraceae bacterium]
MRRFRRVMVVAALLTGNIAAALADPPTADNVKALASHWYEQMQAGQLDRSQLAAGYSDQLTDDAVQEMSRKVNLYGASPTSAEILQSRTMGEQQFYLESKFRSGCTVASVPQLSRAFLGCEFAQERADPAPQRVDRALRGLAQQRFEFGDSLLDRIEV